MDLVTLVTACALGVEPKLMHALVWQQSGGEPWAVSVPNEPMPRVYSSMQQAISETRTASIATGAVRVGLAGLPVRPVEGEPGDLPAVPERCDRSPTHRQAFRPLQSPSTAQGRSDLLRCRHLSRFMGAPRRQVRGSGDGHGCERRCAELRHAKGHQHRVP